MRIKSRIRQRNRGIKFSIFFVFLGVLGYTANFFLRDPRFLVKEIEVMGQVTVSSSSISTLVPKKNIFIYPRQETEKKIKTAFPRLDQVKIEVDLNGLLTVWVNEFPDEYFWCQEKIECFTFVQFLNARGTKIASVSFEPPDVKLVTTDGWDVHYRQDAEAEKLASNFENALTSEALSGKDLAGLEYIDLRFGNKVYYKWKNE